MQDLSKFNIQDSLKSLCLLILDNDEFLRQSLRQQFLAEGFQKIVDIGSVDCLDEVLKKTNPDLILLDIQIPNSNGVDICKRLRHGGFVKPIVMLTVKNAESDIIACLEAGANDYITKPLRMAELLACIYAQLRQSQASDAERFELADLHFLPAKKTLHKANCGHIQVLTEKETKILKFLYQAFPDPVTKEEILSVVWGLQTGLTTHTLETHIYRLRQKISLLTETPLVITTASGYQLDL